MDQALEQVKSGNDYHLVARVRTLLKHIEEDHDDVDQMVEERLPDGEDSHPLVEAVPPLKQWIVDSDYQDGAQPALNHLEAAFQQARENDNQNIAVFAVERLLRLQLSISKDGESTFEEIVDFLESDFNGDDIHLGNFHDLIDLVIEHADQVDDPLLERCLSKCEERRKVQHRQGNYRGERDTLWKIINLKKELDRDIEDEHDLIVESFQLEIDGRQSSQGTAAILKKALVACKQFLDDEKKREWKRNLREENRTAVEKEFAEISPPEEMQEKLAEEAEENVDRIVDWFRSAAETNTNTYVLYCLLKSNGYFPDWETVEEIESESVVSSIFPKEIISHEGDPIETEGSPISDEDVERIPNSYKMQMNHLNRILAQALYRLTEEDDITEQNFLHLLTVTTRLSPDDQLFLTDLISAVFEERYSEAIHLGMSRMESIVTTLLEKTGESVTSVDGTNIQQAGLGGLLRTVEDQYAGDVGYYLRVKYAEKAGENLRNRTNHGQLLYGECNFINSMLILFDIFQILVTVSDSEYTARYSVPKYWFGSK